MRGGDLLSTVNRRRVSCEGGRASRRYIYSQHLAARICLFPYRKRPNGEEGDGVPSLGEAEAGSRLIIMENGLRRSPPWNHGIYQVLSIDLPVQTNLGLHFGPEKEENRTHAFCQRMRRNGASRETTSGQRGHASGVEAHQENKKKRLVLPTREAEEHNIFMPSSTPLIPQMETDCLLVYTYRVVHTADDSLLC
eukprot:gene881-510_t